MDDWTTQAAGAVERAVGMVRERTVGPAQQIVKFVVYGVLVAILALTAVVLFSVLVLRVLNLFLPDWAAWLVLGALFLIAGFVAFAFRTPKRDADTGGNNPPAASVPAETASKKDQSA
jgi:Putative Actinobacterial Holin-X, holin superfamily III